MAARAAWNRYFNYVADVFLCPANFTPAFPHDTRSFEDRTITTPVGERPYNDQAFWVSHASLAGLPAVAAPIGRTPGGLPVGAQFVGPLYEDNTAITFAELSEDVNGGYEPRPCSPFLPDHVRVQKIHAASSIQDQFPLRWSRAGASSRGFAPGSLRLEV
jgi:amidase